MQRARLPYILIPIAAFIAILPLLIRGCSCGHDFDFHLVNWFEAARQFTHGNLHPHWAYTPAYNAGEPRFVFYPPISWIIGAILGLLFPWTWTPILYTWLALTAAGLSLYYLARDFTIPAAATLAAVLYTLNPYMLFTAYERTAYAELLAAAWIPLLLHAILRNKITIPRIAIPIALLWLTNAPAAVMSCYALALLTLIRVLIPGANPGARLQIAANTIAGTALGLGIAAFYIIPAAYERRFVQIAMAIIPFYRIQDNFLFRQTGDIDHDKVLQTASAIAILLLAITAIALIFIRATTPGAPSFAAVSRRVGYSREARTAPTDLPQRQLFYPLTILTIAITLLQTPITSFIWTHAPELAFIQFPWRLLAILAAVLALAIAIALNPLKIKPTTTAILTLLIAATLTYPAYQTFHQTCDPEDTVAARLALFHSNQGTDPTDEYTPVAADNDSLAQTNPTYWLSQDPNAKAPANTQPGPAPTHFLFKATKPGFLILNLRDYPSWEITSTDPNSMHLNHPKHIHRDDGLIVLPLYYAADYTIDIRYARTTDQTVGEILSLTSLALVALVIFSSRKKKLA